MRDSGRIDLQAKHEHHDRPEQLSPALAPTRRQIVAGGLLAALPAMPAWAQAGAGTQFGALRVDVQPLIARGGRGAAQLIAAVLPGKLAESFAGRMGGGPRAPVLVARIDTIYLSLFADTPTTGIGSFGTTDSMEGAGLLLSGRQVVATTPLRVSLPASYSGVYYLPDIDQRRITSLCESFASWLSREL